MDWIVNILLLTATIAVVLLWYLLSEVIDSSPSDMDENEQLSP